MDMVLPPPVCGSGEPDKRLSIMSHVDFLHFAIINAIICLVVMVSISLLTRKRTKEQVGTTNAEFVFTLSLDVRKLKQRNAHELFLHTGEGNPRVLPGPTILISTMFSHQGPD